MIFSRYAHCFERDGITAFWNSLRMVPVYMPTRSANAITQNPEILAAPEFAETMRHLQNAKILVPSTEYDELIIERLRNTVTPPSIKIAYFIPTEDCNCACSYCFVHREMAAGYKPLAMTKEVALAAVETYARLADLQENDGKMIIFYGGEPLLNFEIIKITVLAIEAYQEQKRIAPDIQIITLTNGTLMTDEIAAFFSAHHITASVSLDGDEFVTNSCRVFTNGAPTYQAVRQGIATAQQHDCAVSLSVTISEACVDNFNSTMQVIDDIGTKDIGFNMLIKDGPEDLAYAEQATDFIIKAHKLFREKGIFEDRIMRKVSSFNCADVYKFDCAAAGANQIVIAPDGAIGICHIQLGTRTDFTGNVHDPAFDPAHDPVFMEWNKRTPLNMRECQDCYALGICGGGCPFNARKQYGSIWNIEERFCVHAKKTLEWLVWDFFDNKIKIKLEQGVSHGNT